MHRSMDHTDNTKATGYPSLISGQQNEDTSSEYRTRTKDTETKKLSVRTYHGITKAKSLLADVTSYLSGWTQSYKIKT